jgi:hypothetical protein
MKNTPEKLTYFLPLRHGIESKLSEQDLLSRQTKTRMAENINNIFFAQNGISLIP